MNILYTSFHNINISTNQKSRKHMPSDFDEFVRSYINFAIRNDKNKSYYVQDENTTVVHCVSSILTESLNPSLNPEDLIPELEGFSDSIASKLLREECLVQERIQSMNVKIKFGSLIQALLKDDQEDNHYIYIIAKVEHSEWYDGESLKKTLGFPSEKKNVWKSAVFSMSVGDSIVFDKVSIYTDNPAKYWADSFLELNEVHSDESNTKIALDSIETVLNKSVHHRSRSDYYNLRNAFITAFKSPVQINYPDLINNIVGSYIPDMPELDIAALNSRLLSLPEKKNFDPQFIAVPSVVKKRRRVKFGVTPAIELHIAEGEEHYRDLIHSFTDDNCTRYLKINCFNDSTYELFNH